MRLASFELDGEVGYGALIGDELCRFGPGGDVPAGLKEYLARHHAVWPMLDGGSRISFADLHLLPPVPNPSKIFCVATNFYEPAQDGKPVPDYPLLFTRIAEAQVGHYTPIRKPAVSERYDFEGELAVVIGKAGHKIPLAEAMSHVAGYACFNDGSVRDWQKHSSQFTPGKNFAQSGAFGPWLVTADEIPDPTTLSLNTRVNGVVKQSIDMKNMIFDIAWLIAYCSTFAPLEPGDVIVTGTPSGFGSSRTPPEFLLPGDVVEVEIPGVGLLINRVEQDTDTRELFS